MRICYLANAKSFYFSRWYDFFLTRGHEVHLISGDDSFLPIETQLPDGVKLYYLPEKKLSNKMLSFSYNCLRMPLIIKELRRLIKQISPDIIHAHQITPCGLWAALSNFKPFVMTPMGSDALVLARKYKLYGLITSYVLRKANLITSDSLVLNEAIFEFGGREEKTHLVQNGVDLTKFNPDVERNHIRTKHNIGHGPVILSTRSMLPVYNIDFIIKAIPKVLKHFPNCRFLFLFAHADNLNKAKALADSLKVTNSAMFIGLASYDQMPFYYASSDVCVSVPSSDSSPCSVYEAMACGIPVVISNLPWTKHFMKDRQNALIVQTDPEAIADAVTEILKNELLRGTLVTNGLSTVKEYVDYHKNMEVMEKLMLHIIRRNTC